MKKPDFVACPKCGREHMQGLGMKIHMAKCEGKADAKAIKWTKGESFIGNYHQSDLEVDDQPKYLVVHSSIWGESKSYWIAYEYKYTPDECNHMHSLLAGYKILWDGLKSAKATKEICEEHESQATY